MDDDIIVPARFFDRFLNGFLRDEGFDLAQNYKEGGLAHPGAVFGDFFAWAWEADHDLAVRALAGLLTAANGQVDPYEEKITVDKLLDDLRYALHRTKFARDHEYQEIRDYAETELPGLIDEDE